MVYPYAMALAALTETVRTDFFSKDKRTSTLALGAHTEDIRSACVRQLATNPDILTRHPAACPWQRKQFSITITVGDISIESRNSESTRLMTRNLVMLVRRRGQPGNNQRCHQEQQEGYWYYWGQQAASP